MNDSLYVPGQVLVEFKEGVGEAQQERVEKAAGTEGTIKELGPKDNETIDFIQVKNDQSVETAINKLEADPAVVNAEPNYIYDTNYTPNDPSFSNQWYLSNTGQTIKGQAGTPGADIKASTAWDITTGGDTTVAIIDTGIDFSHPDLASKIWQNVDEIAGNGVDDDGNGYIDDRAGYNTAGISQLSANTWWYFGRESNGRVAQSIKGTGEPLTHVGILAAKAGSPSVNIDVSVRAALTGPNLSTATIAPGEIGSSFGAVYKQLNTPVRLTSGQTYYVVIETNGADVNNYYGLADNYSLGSGYRADPYVDGVEHWYENGAWRDYPGDDFFFTTNPNAVAKDDNGHGTHVGGTIGAQSNNGVGVSGISQGAKIMPLKAGTSDGSLTNASIIEAIYYATNNGAKVINMSFGGSGQSSLTIAAVNYAHANGVTLVAAAGNSGGTSMSYPAGYNNVIGVGATTNRDAKASFSTYNSSVDISAPGQYVYATMPTYAVGLNNYGYAQNYDFLSGTSMAASIAAGVAALLRSHDPALSPDQVEAALKANADDLGAAGRDDSFGSGRVNALRTLGGNSSPGATPSATISATIAINSGSAYANSINVGFSNSATSSDAPITEMRFKNDGEAWSAWEPYAATKNWTLPSGDGAKTIQAQFKDANGNLSQEVSDTIIVDATAPAASLQTPRITTNVTKLARFKVTWAAADPAPSSGISSYDVQYKIVGGDWQDWTAGTTAASAYFSGRPGTNYAFRVRARDVAGNTGEYSGVRRTIVPFDNNSQISSRRGFGRLQTLGGSSYYLNTIRYSTEPDDSIVYRFNGTGVYLISTKAPDRSKAKIYLDGRYIKTIDTHSSGTLYRRVVFSRLSLGDGDHTVKIVNAGNRARLDIDALARVSQSAAAGGLTVVRPGGRAAVGDLAISEPTGDSVIPETADFATERFADPWDMSRYSDLAQGQHMSGLTDQRWGSGLFSARSTGYATVHPLFAGVDGVVFTGRDGYLNRINTTRYNRVSVRMYSDRRVVGKVYWFYNQTWNDFGRKSFIVEPGWHTYIIDPTSTGQWRGKPMGLRFDPANTGGVDLKIDWIRLYQQSDRRVGLTWTDEQPGGTAEIYLDRDQDPTNGNMDLLATRTAGRSNSYQWDPSAFAPDSYYLLVKKTGQAGVYSRRITINRAPLTEILDPDEQGGKDYAATETGNAWDMSQSSDVWYWREMNNVTFANGVMSGSPTNGDSHFHLRVPKGINTDVYHRLSFRFSYDGPYDYGGGTMARALWSSDHNKLELFQTMNDLPTYPTWETYTVDLNKVGIDGGTIGWNGIVNDFRFDPSEGSIRSRFHLDYIRIKADDSANRAFTIKWRDRKTSPLTTHVDLFYDTNKTGFNGRPIVRNRLQVGGVNKYVWRTANVPAGKYFVYAVASDDVNVTKTYSSGPLSISH